MKTNKTSKRALLTSVLSIALCLSMLIGTTFAWFTDTATTSVSKIVSGKLDIDLVDASNQTVTGRQLNWQTAGDRAQSAILWEPGCTYNLEPVKLVNNGNLAAKCAVKITGVTGSNKLLEALDWTLNGEPMADQTIVLYPTTSEVRPSSLELNITASMKTTAGNEYQNLTLDGIAITVYATQAQYESDSEDNTYDAGADMTPDNLDKMVVANVTKTAQKDEATILTAEGVTATVPANGAAEGNELTLTVQPKSAAPAGLAIDTGKGIQAYDISVTGLAEDNNTPVEVKLFVGKGLTGVTVYHKTESIGSTYDGTTGCVTFTTTSFSPFTVVYDEVASANGVAYGTLQEALEAGGNVVLMRDSTITNTIEVTKDVTLNLNGKTLTANTKKSRMLWITKPGVTLTIDGTTAGSGITMGDTQAASKDEKVWGFVDIRGEAEGSKLIVNGGNYTGSTCANDNYNYGCFFMVRCDSEIELNNITAETDVCVVNFFTDGKMTVKDASICITGIDAYLTGTLYTGYSNATFENVTLTAKYGGCIQSAGTTTLKNCNIKVTDTRVGEGTHQNCAVAAQEGANVTVESGSYSAPYAAYVYSSGGTINIKGGTFTGKLRADQPKEGSSELNITGGTFSVNPEEFVAKGYTTTQNGDWYTVSK